MQRFLAIIVLIVVAAAGAGYLVLDRRHDASLEESAAAGEAALLAQRQEADAVARELAADVARCLAATLADDIAAGDLAALDEHLVAVVQGHRVAGVLLLTPDGRVISSTDLRFRGRTFDDAASRAAVAVSDVTILEAAPAEGQIEVAAPLISGDRRVGTLRVFVEVDDRPER